MCRHSLRLLSTAGKKKNNISILHWQLTGLLRNGVEWRKVTAEILEMQARGWEFNRTVEMKVSKKG